MQYRSLLGLGALVIVFGLFISKGETVSAHAALARSTPASQARLPTAPASIDLWFTEPLEPQFSTFELYASDGQRLPVDAIQVDANDARHLSGRPLGLKPGLYTVGYKTLSTLDGHEWTGSFSFAVLDASGAMPGGAAFAPNLATSTSPANVLGRWFIFIGLSVILGGAGILLLVARVRDVALIDSSRALYRRLTLAALPLLAVGPILQLQAQHDAVGGSFNELLAETRFGTFWLWRELLVLAIATVSALLLLAAKRRRARWERALRLVLALLATGAFATVTLVGHAAAAPGRFWAIAGDFAHLTIAGLWVGGLVMLAALFVTSRGWTSANGGRAALLVRFSAFAMTGLYLLAATGVLRSLGQLPTMSALFDSSYGRWLLIKLGLIALALAVAFTNRRLLRPLTGSRQRQALARSRLRWLLPLEAGLAVAILFSVAVLGQTPPIQRAQGTDAALGSSVSFTEESGGLTMHLQVTPAQVGTNEFRVHVYRADGGDLGAVDQVLFTLIGGEGSEGGDQIQSVAEGSGVFVASGALLNRAQTWGIQVDVQRPEQDDTRFEYQVPFAEGAGGGTIGDLFKSPAPQLKSGGLSALLLLGLGLGLIVTWRRGRRGRPATARAVGAVFVFGGLLMFLSSGGSLARDTFPATPASIERGRPLYAANCASCHGETGRGDGVAAAELKPPPADLTFHLPLHGDDGIYFFIANGAPGTAMPGWKDELSEKEIWDIVNYIRSEFAGGFTPSAAAR